MPRWDRTKQGVRLDAYGRPMSPEKARWHRQQEDRRRQDDQRLLAASKSQSKIIRRTNNVTTKNRLGHDPSENDHERRARKQNNHRIAEAVAWKLLETGQITEKEARQIGQYIMKDAQAEMSTEEWVALRESPQWDAYEESMRRTSDNVDSRTWEAEQDISTRKLMGKVLSRAWADGKISDDDYRTELNRTLHIHGDGATQELLVGAAVDILEPDPDHPVIWEAPPPPPMIGHATEAEMKGRYTPQDDRTNSPSARERRREAAQAAKDSESFRAAKAEKELTEAKHSNRALDEVERAITTAQLDTTQAKYDAQYGSGDGEGGAA